MSNEYLTVKQVSSILGVSVQTLRNWDDNGYLKASRTFGKHRRYLKSNIDNFLHGRTKVENFASSFEAQHLNDLYKQAENEVANCIRSKPYGGFTKSQIALLLRNQKTLPNEAAISDELFFEVAASLCSPYFFETHVMLHPITLVSYKRVRNNRIVLEMEDSCANTYTNDDKYYNDEISQAKSIARNVDEVLMNIALSNAKFLIDSNCNEIDINIKKAIKAIDDNTGTKEPKVIVFPPELSPIKENARKLNDNLIYASNEDLIFTQTPEGTSCTAYVSRIVPHNQILIGVKSKDGFSGAYFCPYILMYKNNTSYKLAMRASNRLLRQGSNYFAAITVK